MVGGVEGVEVADAEGDFGSGWGEKILPCGIGHGVGPAFGNGKSEAVGVEDVDFADGRFVFQEAEELGAEGGVFPKEGGGVDVTGGVAGVVAVAEADDRVPFAVIFVE